eukprot:TRINITY_DN61434_c0_g1_i1.p1 TRINITY_DN61434_c0_g1~~TRINITY_DN61434_c0_g1_i1.p1  ORF type:complete len:109 (-),score=44.14 TRINITY_DN61434_c0_g1_i1:159-485(-)
MIRRPPRSTLSSSSAASDVYKRQQNPFSGPGFPAEVVMEFAKNGANDQAIAEFANYVNPNTVVEALPLCGNNLTYAARIGIVVAKKNCTPQEAATALAAVNYNMSQLQ